MIPQTRVRSPKYIKNSHDSTPGRQTMQLKNGQTNWTNTSLWRTYRGPETYERCSASLAIRERQIKTTVRYHLTSAKVAIINKPTSNKCWRGCGERGIFLHCQWECRLVQPLYKAGWRYLKKLKMELPFDPAILLLGRYPRKLETLAQKNICTPMFIATLFTIAKIWKQLKCPSLDEWIKQLWDIYIIKFYSAVKKRKSCPLQQYGWSWRTLCLVK